MPKKKTNSDFNSRVAAFPGLPQEESPRSLHLHSGFGSKMPPQMGLFKCHRKKNGFKRLKCPDLPCYGKRLKTTIFSTLPLFSINMLHLFMSLFLDFVLMTSKNNFPPRPGSQDRNTAPPHHLHSVPLDAGRGPAANGI